MIFNNRKKRSGSSEYDPIEPCDVPTSYQREIPSLTVEQVAETLKKAKKSMSMVPGDINPMLYNQYSNRLATPITHIYNVITKKKDWPHAWKVENVTIIPKSNAASTPSECRNISCTNLLSKVYESFVLTWDREEVIPKSNQYGGESGCSTVHFANSVMDFFFNSADPRGIT